MKITPGHRGYFLAKGQKVLNDYLNFLAPNILVAILETAVGGGAIALGHGSPEAGVAVQRFAGEQFNGRAKPENGGDGEPGEA